MSRYPYNGEATSFVNRVYNVFCYGNPEDEGVPYQAVNSPLVAAMWYEADSRVDWGGETDAVLATFPKLQEAWEIQITWGEDNKAHRMTKLQQKLESQYHNAEDRATELLNQIYLATLVAAGLANLREFPVNPTSTINNSRVWGDVKEGIDGEFGKEIKEMNAILDAMLDVIFKYGKGKNEEMEAAWSTQPS